MKTTLYLVKKIPVEKEWRHTNEKNSMWGIKAELLTKLNINCTILTNWTCRQKGEQMKSIKLIEVSNKGKAEYIDKERHPNPNVGSFRRSNSLLETQIDQQENEWKRKSDKIKG